MNSKGQTLIEVIVAMTVGILVVMALVLATIFSLRNASFAKNSAQATKLAQEGIERVRMGRDGNSEINISGSSPSVTSWNGSITASFCSGSSGSKADSIWCGRVSDKCGSSSDCFFNVTRDGKLHFLINGLAGSESIEPNFKRAVILYDTDIPDQKKVTVIVTWTDFAGPHESRLITILRRL